MRKGEKNSLNRHPEREGMEWREANLIIKAQAPYLLVHRK